MHLDKDKQNNFSFQVVNSSDPSWWQARHEEGDTIGLIPSQDLEERRKCFVEKPDMSTFSKWSSCCGAGVRTEFIHHIKTVQKYLPVLRL